MIATSPRRLRCEKIIYKSYFIQRSSENHPSMDSNQNNVANIDSHSNSSENHQNGTTMNSQVKMNNQIVRLQTEVSEI